MLFKIICILVLVSHIYYAFIEIFLWDRNRARRIYNFSMELSFRTKKIGLIFGIYRLFIVVLFLLGLLSFYVNSDMAIYILLGSLYFTLIISAVFGMIFHFAFFVFQFLPALIALIIYY